MFKIAILILGASSNLQAIFDQVKFGRLNCKIEMIISDNQDVLGLLKA